MNLRDQFGDFDERREFEYWIPEPGNEVVGYIVGIGTTRTKFGPKPHIDVRDDFAGAPTIRVVATRIILRDELDLAKPQLGDALLIRYDGPAVSKNGRPIHKYTVRVIHAQ